MKLALRFVLLIACILSSSAFALEQDASSTAAMMQTYKKISAAQNKWTMSRVHSGIVTLNGKFYVSSLQGLFTAKKLKPGAKFKSLTNIGNTVADNIVNTLFVANGVVYAGTANGVIYSKNNGKSWVRKNILTGSRSNFITSLYVTNNKIYVGTKRGLFVFFKGWKIVKHYTYNNGMPTDIINDIYVQNRNIYVATPVALAISHDAGKSWHSYYPTSNIISNIFTTVSGGGGVVYAGTVNGLYVSLNNGQNWKHYAKAGGLGSNMIYAISVSNGVPYVGTAAGLAISLTYGSHWHLIPRLSPVSAIYVTDKHMYFTTNNNVAALAKPSSVGQPAFLSLKNYKQVTHKIHAYNAPAVVKILSFIIVLLFLLALIVYIIFVIVLFKAFRRVPRQFRISAGWVWFLFMPLANAIFNFVICYAAVPNAMRRFIEHQTGNNKDLLATIAKLKSLGLIFALLIMSTGLLAIAGKLISIPDVSHAIFALRFFVSMAGTVIFILYWTKLARVKKLLPKTTE